MLSIEGELVIAREIQASILPSNQPGDRFLLYTDGVSEPENGSGEAFGAHKLEQVVQNNRLRAPSELLDQLLTEIREWQPVSAEQKDDITLVAIDVLS